MMAGNRSDFGTARPASAEPGPTAADASRSPGDDRIAALAALVESITEQIDAIEGVARRERALPAAPAPRFELPRQPAPRPADPQSGRLDAIESRLAALTGQMAARAAERPAPGRPEIAVDPVAIEDAIMALRADIATLGRRIGSESRRAEEMDKALRSDLGARIDGLPHEGSGLFDELRRHLAEIREAIEASARETTLASIEAGYGHVIERLDEIVRRVPDRARLDGLAAEVARIGALLDRAKPLRSVEGELEDIRNAIASLATVRADTGLERPIDALRKAIERLAALPAPKVDLSPIERELAVIRREVDGFARGTDPVLLLRLEQQVGAVHAMLAGSPAHDQPGGITALGRLEARIDALSGRFDAVVDADGLQPAAAAIEGLREEMSELRQQIVLREPVRFDAIDRQMQALMERLDAAAQPADNRTLGQLEARLTALADTLGERGPASAGLGKVAENIDRLHALIGDNRRETIEAARDAARSTLAEFAGRLPRYPDEDLIRALREDLGSLQATLRSGRDGRDMPDMLASVHGTLARVVDGIAELEGVQRREPAAAASLRSTAVPAEDHRPLAPGSGRPQPTARPTGAMAATDRAPPRPGDRKADFIAAARRAAQAAETDAARSGAPPVVPADLAAEAAPQGPLARLGRALRARRTLFVLAVAGLALAGLAYGPSLVAGTGVDDSPLDPARTGAIGPSRPPARASALDGRPGLVAPGKGGALAFAPASALARPFAAPPGRENRIDIALVEQDADAGDAVAAFVLARHFSEDADPDMARAAAWYDVAARRGLAVAAYELGVLQERGDGVPRDIAAAEGWYRRAASAGNVRAMHNLGVLIGGAPAAALFAEAAQFGIADSQYNLGVLYAQGRGVTADPAEAYVWFALAARQGDPDAVERRDEMERELDAASLALARLAVDTFRPKLPDPAANAEPMAKAGWFRAEAAAAFGNRTG